MDLSAAQAFMQQSGIDAWLLYDFRNSNPLLWHVLGSPKHTTRRNFLLIPRTGSPRLLVHAIDENLFTPFNYPRTRYVSWQDLHAQLRTFLAGSSRVAMEYSPGAAIPVVSYADAGIVELIRSLGLEVVSSADLFQIAATQWDTVAYDSHRSAARLIDAAKDAAFRFIGQSLAAARSLSEYDVQQFLMDQFAKDKLWTDDPPIVSVNQNSGNPHYQPTRDHSSPIHPGDWVLIDLWAKHPGDPNTFADITWTGFVGSTPTPEHVKIFNLVTQARDAVVARLQQAWKAGEELRGWQLDRVARTVIENAGYGDSFFHRTGHSMGPGNSDHALGVNLDDLETHDTRRILPGIGFSVEPGIYLPTFGVRSEIDVFIHPFRNRRPALRTSLLAGPQIIPAAYTQPRLPSPPLTPPATLKKEPRNNRPCQHERQQRVIRFHRPIRPASRDLQRRPHDLSRHTPTAREIDAHQLMPPGYRSGKDTVIAARTGFVSPARDGATDAHHAEPTPIGSHPILPRSLSPCPHIRDTAATCPQSDHDDAQHQRHCRDDVEQPSHTISHSTPTP
ncbi:MAG TPA: M24 family metallopeptidase, partial [Tepidisphaeraceae bacterium]|nr:M24 family metallopeptidase [Tepidisphaeraceae bacterium]